MTFLEALKNRANQGQIPVIPDIKCFSPKEGDLMAGRDPVMLARELAAAGACVLSVVTEEKEFHGSLELLRRICDAVSIPVLRKDFIETVQDLRDTKEAGADAILLMYACLGKEKLESLYYAAKGMGLTPFVETHTAQELAWAGELGAALAGINNRDILVLERDSGDYTHAAALLDQAPAGAFLVAESGIGSPDEARSVIRSGADAVLVGTAILRSSSPADMYRAMSRPCGLKICGLMDREGIGLCGSALVDMVGFVTEYPAPVPWNLNSRETALLLDYAAECGKKNRLRTCIVTGGTPEKILSLARRLRPDAVQLHYMETLEETAHITKALHEERMQVIRSVPMDQEQRKYMFGTSSIPGIREKLEETAVDAVLLDSRDGRNAAVGGTGILDRPELVLPQRETPFTRPGSGHDRTVQARKERSRAKLVIGGGIHAGNVAEAVRRLRPDMVDIMTGVEDAPGRKSAQKLYALLAAMDSH